MLVRTPTTYVLVSRYLGNISIMPVSKPETHKKLLPNTQQSQLGMTMCGCFPVGIKVLQARRRGKESWEHPITGGRPRGPGERDPMGVRARECLVETMPGISAGRAGGRT